MAGQMQGGGRSPGGGPPRGRAPQHRAAPQHRSVDRATINRRRFLVLAAGGAVVAGVGVGAAEALGSSSDPHDATRLHAKAAKPRPTGTSVVNTKLPSGVVVPVSPVIVAENAKIGHAWWVTTPQQPGDIEGYASQASGKHGDTVALFVSTKAPHFHVEAYRMGYYQGIGARLVWQSDEVAGARQALPTVNGPTNTIECNWEPSLSFTIRPTWPPGAYLLKLVGVDQEQQFVPFCIRDDRSHAAVVIQHSVTTWQAYNRWGGYSLYYGNTGGALSFTHAPGNGSYDNRSRIVTFDRPYDHDWASGAADLVGNEFPVIFQAERLGLDVTYWTDVDLHARPQLLANHKALISLGHDEYWSYEMRAGALQALSKGTNFAFLGANACYRQIRFQPSNNGTNRQQICYKSAAEDPMNGTNDQYVTVNWPEPPVSLPESELIGSTYQDVGAQAPMLITDPSSWLFEGTGFTQDQSLPNIVVGEFDRYVPGSPGPTNVDVVAHSLVANRHGNYSDVTWYTAANGGGGVFASGNASWVGALADSTLVPPNVVPDASPSANVPLLRVMENLYSVIAMGPASLTHPSQGSWQAVYRSGAGYTPATNNAA